MNCVHVSSLSETMPEATLIHLRQPVMNNQRWKGQGARRRMTTLHSKGDYTDIHTLLKPDMIYINQVSRVYVCKYMYSAQI